MLKKHAKTTGDYDRIYTFFLGGDIYDICYRIWEFCKENIEYDEETKDAQYISSPITILKNGYCDCKGYALFCAGILDAMKRQGENIEWEFRYVSYKMLKTDPGHVFVVVNPKEEDIWIDPVLNYFDYHLTYWHATNKKVTTKQAETIGFIGGLDPVGFATAKKAIGKPGPIPAGATPMPVPAGYPSTVPRPYMTSDGKLILAGGPDWRWKGDAQTNAEVAAMQAALQPLIIQYAKQPYNIYWALSGWGSGFENVISAAGGMAAFNNTGRDFLQFPEMPSGLDKIEMQAANLVPTLVAAAINVVAPGAGTAAGNLVHGELANSGVNVSTSLTAQGTNAVTTAGTGNNKVLLIGAALLLVLLLSNKK